MHRILAGVLALAACTARPTTPPPAADANTPVECSAAYLRAGDALTRQDYPAAVTALREIIDQNPGDDAPAYLVAVALAAGGHKQDAARALRRLAESGSTRVPQAHDFPGLDADTLRSLAAAAQANLPPPRSTVAHTLAQADLIPEGITHDPQTGRLFVGSTYRRKIVAVAQDGATRDLVAAGTIDAPLGMRVDVERRALWVATVAIPTMEGYQPELRSRSSLLEIDVDSGAVRRTALRGRHGHLLNDLVLDRAGACFVTDSERGEVLRLDPGAQEFTVLVPAGELSYPNGLTLADDGRTLFVADFVRGLTSIDIASGTRTIIKHRPGMFTHGFDGLYTHRGALIGVDNGAGQGRVVRMQLSPGRDVVTRLDVLEAGHPAFRIPTTGTIVGDDLIYIANSQIRSFTDNKIWPPEQLQPVVLLRLPLAGG